MTDPRIKYLEKFSPDTRENWQNRLLLRNTGGEDYSMVKRPNGAQLLLPKATARELTCYCPTCAKPLKDTKPQIYFGDWICGICFQQFTGKEPK